MTQLWVLGALVAVLGSLLWWFVRAWMRREEQARELVTIRVHALEVTIAKLPTAESVAVLSERVRLLEVIQARLGTSDDLANRVIPQLVSKLDEIQRNLRSEWKDDLSEFRVEVIRLLEAWKRGASP